MTLQTHPACSLYCSSVLCVRPVSRVRFLVGTRLCCFRCRFSCCRERSRGDSCPCCLRVFLARPRGAFLGPRLALCVCGQGSSPCPAAARTGLWLLAVSSFCSLGSSSQGAMQRSPVPGVPSSQGAVQPSPASGVQLSGCRAAGRGRQWCGTVWVLACGSLVTSGPQLLLLCCLSSVSLGDTLVQGLCPFPCLHRWVVCC